MPESLSDRIDHLTATAKAIRASAAAVVPSEDNAATSAIPFTRAVLDTALGDLIRDIDASELGLFTLVPAPDADVRKQSDGGARRGEISRVEFPGATPLRKPPARRENAFKVKEYEPEVYAHAALKYLDRFQSIRRMPHARSLVTTFIEQLDETRDNIKRLKETLQELTSAAAASGPTQPTTGVAEEERRITDLQNRLVELRSQKEALLRSNESKPAPKPKATSRPNSKPPLSPEPEPDAHEEAFWSTPATSGRTLRFTDRLLEDDPDFAELSTMSNDSPGPAPPKSVFARFAASGSSTDMGLGTLSEDDIFGGPPLHQGKDEDAEEGLHELPDSLEGQPEPERDFEPSASVDSDEEVEQNQDEEHTVVLSKMPFLEQDNLLTSPTVDSQPRTTSSLTEAQSSPSSSLKSTKVRITAELESIVVRIWTTVGDILLPSKDSGKLPRAEETLALIGSLAARSLSPVSPTSSFSSTTGGPTPHQVNTAQLLQALLTAPNHAMPLNQLKAAIGGTRALYACVAKKLIRIDRGGREQIVLFDA